MPVWCRLCTRNVVPRKEFNWLPFLFCGGFFYLAYYLFMKKPECPVCKSDSNFDAARPE